MRREKDTIAMLNSKKLIHQQIEDTKKLNLGLDADSSSKYYHKSTSRFSGFINQENLPPLYYK